VFEPRDQLGVKVINGERYYNMTRCAAYLSMSPQGWRKKRDSMVRKGALKVWKFPSEPKCSYVKEADLVRMSQPVDSSSDIIKRAEGV